MDMPISESKRASTRFCFQIKKDGKIKPIPPHIDECVIFPDELNEGCYIALSRQTSKVGWGKSIDDAYVDLVAGIALAFKYSFEKNIKAKIGTPSLNSIWTNNNERRISRLSPEVQTTLIQKALRTIRGESESENKISEVIFHEKLSDTIKDFVMKLEVA